MGAVRDEQGEMVATQTLDAAVVVARFRNVAERGGRIDLGFRIVVPGSLMDRNWQLRYTPTMYIMGDTLSLDKVLITGEMYRRRQLRGYQQYERFLASIITDTTAFIDYRMLEIFLRRNIPQLYAFRTDTTFVDDSVFYSAFGVNSREAMDHYTNHMAYRFNELRKGRSEKKFRQYVRAPFLSGGVRLDTVMRDTEGNYVYDYTQTINTRPRLRKVDIVLDGQIYERDVCLYDIPRSEPLTFFISSLSSLVDGRDKYVTTIVTRKVRADASYNIDFPLGGSEILPGYNENAREISRIKERLSLLMQNEVFDLDSVNVVASCSPEGRVKYNAALSDRRSKSITRYFQDYMDAFTDSLARESGFSVNADSEYRAETALPCAIEFHSRPIAENWDYLATLVEMDSTMSVTAKEEFFAIMGTEDVDKREQEMSRQEWYQYLKKDIYPSLRRVQFQFSLSRKGLQADTLLTTVLDENYMSGVRAIRDRDYEKALEILSPYADFNTAVAMLALDRNASAMSILEHCPKTASREYMMAIIHARRGERQKAVQAYLDACAMNRQFIHRGNLDPEISELIRAYSINFNQ